MLPEGSHLHEQDSTIFILNRRKNLKNYLVFDVKQRQLVIAGTAFRYEQVWEPLIKGEQTIEISGSKLIVSKDGKHKVPFNILNQDITWTNNILYFPNVVPPLGIRFDTVDDRVFFAEFLLEASIVQYQQSPIPKELKTIAESYHVTLPVLYVLNMVATKQIEGARRGARVKSIAIACKRPWVHVFRPVLLLALDQFFQNPRIEVLEAIYNSINSIDLYQFPMLTFSEKKTIRSFVRNKVPHFDGQFKSKLPKLKYYTPEDLPLNIMKQPLEYEIPVRFDGVNLPLKIPSVSYDSEIGDFSVSNLIAMLNSVQVTNQNTGIKYRNAAPYCWHPHLDIGATTSPLSILLFGLLTEKRIVFVGHQKPCKEIANCVLASIAIASGGDLIPGVSDRCFPYASLANVENLLKVNGFVAGVSNPVFEEQQSWWDICINLSTLKLTISSALIKSVVPEVKDVEQFVVCEEDDMLVQEVVEGIKRHLDEQHIRMLMYRYVERFVDMVNRFSPNASLQDVNPSWTNRIDGWLKTSAYKYLNQGGARVRKSLFGAKDVHGMIQQIAYGTSIKMDSLIRMFHTLDELVQCASDHQILEILASLQQTEGSCAPFSFGLFHERMEIRMAAARIILCIYAQKV
jgi:hypothetical protein